MPECIVCKGYYDSSTVCPRCGSNNKPWDNWQTERSEEQGGIEGLLAFYEPYLYLPFFTVVIALAFGLLGLGGLWKGVTVAAQVLALMVTTSGCLVAALAGYALRHDIREQELLNKVRRGYRAKLGSIQFQTVALPALALLLVFLVTFTLVKSDVLWYVLYSAFLDPAYLEQIEQREVIANGPAEVTLPEEIHQLLNRFKQIIPLALMGMYSAFMISFSYVLSLQSARVYSQEMNRILPKPIFLQEEKLAQLVQEQAKQILCKPTQPKEAGSEHKSTEAAQGESRAWVWDAMERTDTGGIRLTARGESEDSRVEESVTGHRTRHPEFVDYTIEADPWGRILSITRGERRS